MENIVIEEKYSKALGLFVSGVLMVALCAGVFFLGMLESSVIYQVIGIVAGIFFLACTIYLFGRAIKSRALLTIMEDGIEDSSSASSVGFIPYHEIKRFEIINIFGQRMIGVHLRNEERFISELPPMKQKAAKSNLKLKFPPIAIRVETAKDMTIEDIFTLLQKRLSDYSCFYSE